MGIKFLTQENNSSRGVPARNRTQAQGLELHDYQADTQTAGLIPINLIGSLEKDDRDKVHEPDTNNMATSTIFAE